MPDILLLAHKDNRDTPRIRAVLNHVSDCIQALGPILQPEGANLGTVRAAGA